MAPIYSPLPTTPTCIVPGCGSALTKFGHVHKGSQRYRCANPECYKTVSGKKIAKLTNKLAFELLRTSGMSEELANRILGVGAIRVKLRHESVVVNPEISKLLEDAVIRLDIERLPIDDQPFLQPPFLAPDQLYLDLANSARSWSLNYGWEITADGELKRALVPNA